MVDITRPEIVYVALGSNLGDRYTHLRNAITGLNTFPEVSILRCSPVYETEAHTLTPGEEQPAFLNAVVEIATTVDPLDLLHRCQQVERREGRNRDSGVRWEPRTLDVDLICAGDRIYRLPGLTLPHPLMAERRFVLAPLADLAPDLLVPEPFARTVGELLAVCPDRTEVKKTSFILF